jgi:hypothetical protein
VLPVEQQLMANDLTKQITNGAIFQDLETDSYMATIGNEWEANKHYSKKKNNENN